MNQTMTPVSTLCTPLTPIAITLAAICSPTAYAELNWQQRSISFDATVQESQFVARFAFTNVGDDPVTIEEVNDCCGISTTPLVKTIYLPGETGVIETTFKFGDRKGRQLKRFHVKTSDREKPIDLVIRGTIPEVLRIRPRFVYWRPNTPRDPRKVTVLIKHKEPITIKHVLTSDPAVSATWKTIKAGRQYEVLITPPPDGVGANARVHLEFDDPKLNAKGFSIQVRANGPIAPNVGTVDSTATTQPATTRPATTQPAATQKSQKSQKSTTTQPTQRPVPAANGVSNRQDASDAASSTDAQMQPVTDQISPGPVE